MQNNEYDTEQQYQFLMTYQIDLYLKSFNTFYIEKTQTKILQINNYLTFFPQKNLERFVSLPTCKKKYTVLRSPHIDKKSREQFEWKRYKKSLFLFFGEKKTYTLFLFLLKNSSFPGVQVEINVKHSTFFSNTVSSTEPKKYSLTNK